MKTSLKAAPLLAGLVLTPALSQAANITLALGGGVLYKNNGTTPLSLNSTIVLLADNDGDGFGNQTQAITSWTADPGDVVVARFGTNNAGDVDQGTFSQLLSGIPVIDVNTLTGLTAGRQLMVVWYDKPFNAADTGPGNGVFFGQYRTDSVLDFSDIAWIVPSTGTKSLNFLTAANSGTQLEAAGRANLQTQVVPEPASLGVLALGGMMLVRRRSRAKA